jgi:hypothetical protein
MNRYDADGIEGPFTKEMARPIMVDVANRPRPGWGGTLGRRGRPNRATGAPRIPPPPRVKCVGCMAILREGTRSSTIWDVCQDCIAADAAAKCQRERAEAGPDKAVLHSCVRDDRT